MGKLEAMVMAKWMRAKSNMVSLAKRFLLDENGDTNMISIILILVIVIGLAAMFRTQIGTLVTQWWAQISGSAAKATQGF